jgi:hypothetical protein
MTPVDEVRLEIGDEDSAAQLFTDPQIEKKLSDRGGAVLATAADLCDILATRFAGAFDFSSAARQEFKRSQKSQAYERRAESIRKRIGGLTTVSTTRVDGFSDDITTRDGAAQGSRTGRVKAGYFDPDIPY